MSRSPSQTDASAPTADAVGFTQADNEALWNRGYTRRRVLQGLGAVGVAALGAQFVTVRSAFAATPSPGVDRTLVVVNLKGGCDSLRALVPAGAQVGGDDLRAIRPNLVPGDSDLLALSGTAGWALNSRMAPLMPYWKSGELAFVPAVMSPGGTRSHFVSQRFLQCGTVKSATTGWMDRVLQAMPHGTTFQAMGVGSGNAPMSYLGSMPKVVIDSLDSFDMPSAYGKQDLTMTTTAALAGGFAGANATSMTSCITALSQLTKVGRTGAEDDYTGSFGSAMSDLARLLQAEIGVQIATVDLGGWDTHTQEARDFDSALGDLSSCLAAFMEDLGPARRSRVTVLVMSEFGRRAAQNPRNGTDHGLGGMMMVLGGGLRKSQVAGSWQGMSTSALDRGVDVPGLNDPFAIMGEAAVKVLGVGSVAKIFPDARYAPLNLFTASPR